jgi:hypothetical protein
MRMRLLGNLKKFLGRNKGFRHNAFITSSISERVIIVNTRVKNCKLFGACNTDTNYNA